MAEPNPKPTRKQKIGHGEFVRFRFDWWASKYPNQRFGQAFMNHFTRLHGIHFPELYYANNADEAELLIYKHLIKFND